MIGSDGGDEPEKRFDSFAAYVDHFVRLTAE
jgi:hypothetical protein